MQKTLHLNTAAIKNDYIVAMAACADKLLDHYYKEVTAAMRTESGRGDVKTERMDDAEKGLLVRRIIGGAYAIEDSWGTGSKMDTSNSALNDYLSSDLYNPARPKTPCAPITGRPEGDYINFLGETKHSSGAMEGLNLEINPNSPITARAPSGAFQDADKWFTASDMAREEFSKTTKEFFAGVRSNPSKYFRFG